MFEDKRERVDANFSLRQLKAASVKHRYYEDEKTRFSTRSRRLYACGSKRPPTKAGVYEGRKLKHPWF